MALGAEASRELAARMGRREHCDVHGEEVVKFYCGVCNSFVCQDCVLVRHMDHDPVGLSQIAKDHRSELEVVLASALGTLMRVREGLTVCEDRVKYMEDVRSKVTLSITNAFEELHRALEERCGVLVGRVESLTNSKVESLRVQKAELAKLERGLVVYSEVASNVLQTHTDCEVVAMKRLLPSEMEPLVGGVATPLNLKLPSDITCGVDTGLLKKHIAHFGLVDYCCPSKSTWTQVYTSPPMVDTQYRVKLECKDSKGDRMTVGGLEVRGELRPKMDDQPCVTGEVEDHGDGTYTITLTPPTTGHYQLSITIHGHHVHGSPYALRVTNTGRDYGKLTAATAVIPVNAPYNVAVHDNGDIYVTGGTNCIRVFDPAGNNLFTIGEGGCGDGQFYNPRGIAIEGDTLYVADDSNNRVQKLTKRGEFVRKFGERGLGPSCFNGPMDVHVDTAGQLYIADYNNHRVQVFRADGTFVYSIPGSVPGGGAFSFPWGVALDYQGYVHVVAWSADSVKVFGSGGTGGTPEGTFVRKYGNLTHPTGIAVDQAGICFVTDYGTNSLSIFDPQGNLLHTIRGLNRPYGVTVDRNGFVYVANSGANQILRY